MFISLKVWAFAVYPSTETGVVEMPGEVGAATQQQDNNMLFCGRNRISARTLQNDLKPAIPVHVSSCNVRNRLHDGGTRALHPQLGPILTVQDHQTFYFWATVLFLDRVPPPLFSLSDLQWSVIHFSASREIVPLLFWHWIECSSVENALPERLK